MQKFFVFLSVILLLCLLAALPAIGQAAGAEAMLYDLARALDAKDISRLRELIDAQSMVYIATIVNAPDYPKKDPLESLPGTTSMDTMRRTEERLFDRLSSGMEQNACRHAGRPGCPWVPETIAATAVLIAESGDITIYGVDNRRGIRTWLLLKREAGSWRAWAIADSDKEARLIASPEFQETLARVRRELPARIEASARARAEREKARAEEYKQRMDAIEQRNRAEKAVKEALACRILRMSVEEREPRSQIAAPAFEVLLLTLEVHNANSFTVLPKTWALTFSRQDGTQVKAITLDHQRDGDNAPLTAGERKTLTLTTRRFDEKYIAGWNKGEYSAKAELLNFDRQ